jgi:hypothetical protein
VLQTVQLDAEFLLAIDDCKQSRCLSNLQKAATYKELLAAVSKLQDGAAANTQLDELCRKAMSEIPKVTHAMRELLNNQLQGERTAVERHASMSLTQVQLSGENPREKK